MRRVSRKEEKVNKLGYVVVVAGLTSMYERERGVWQKSERNNTE